ncbi:AI-2E family transporter [Archangium violaceum]|uniref:AI-2E family transporter n=1 Tax=Archangium violaceum TaxID=83451 RepID=UPI00193C3606|nr:AI-2E family transporter [Archangium violaceum]QRK04429.1 AI-2E family transporter [Archangium violaceum]
MDPERPVRSPIEPVNEREPVPVPRSQVTVKTVLTICCTVVGVVAAIYLLIHGIVTITLSVTAVLLAVAFNHGVERLERWGLRRPLAIGVVMSVVLGAIVGASFLIIPPTVAQVRDLVDRLPELNERMHQTQLFQWLDARFRIDQRLGSLGTGNTGLLQWAVNPAMRLLGGLVTGAGAFLTVLFLVVFMLAYGGRVVRGVLAESLPAHRQRYERVLGKVYHSVGGYLSGLAIIGVVNAVFASLFLAIIGVPFFLPLGILSGLGSLIPLLGATLAGFVLCLVALASGGPLEAVVVFVYVCCYQQFENHVLAPVIYKRTVELNPLVTLLGILLFAELAGVLGAFLAVPVVGACQIVIRELLLLRRERLNLPLKGDVAEQLEKRGLRRPPFWRRPRHA